MLRADGTEKAGAEAVSQQRAVCVESVRVYNRSEYVSDYLLRGNTRCWSVLYRRSAIGQIRFREDLSIGEDMMFLMDLLMQISSVSITEYRGYFTGLTSRARCSSPLNQATWMKSKAGSLPAGLWKRVPVPERAGIQYSGGFCDAGCRKIARLPGAERKNTRRKSYSATVLSRKDLLLPEQRGAAEGLSDKNDAVHHLSAVVSCVVSSLEKLK